MAELPNIHHLRAFALAARLNSVHQAAAVAHLSQPAVTQALARLEARYDCRFLDRRSTGVYPTDEGCIMLARVERALELIEDAARRIRETAKRSARKGPSGQVDRLATTAQLRALVAIARTGSFSAAARSLGLAQPSVHRAARDLEQLTGVPLFERVSQGVTLTAPGQMLAQRAALAFREIEAAADDLDEAAGAVRGRLLVGSLAPVRTEILPAALIALTERFPAARVRVDDSAHADQLRALRLGEIDLIVGALRQADPGDDIEEEVLFDDTLSLVARRDHPLAGRARIGAADLAAFPWAVPRKGTRTRELFETLVGEEATPGLVETRSLTVIRGLLLSSDRLALLSRREISCEERAGLLTVLAFELADTPRPICIIRRANWRPTRLQAAFMDILRETARRKDPLTADAV